MSKQRLYFDYASTTPLLEEAKEAMLPFWSGSFGNPGSLHSFGQEAVTALDKSREVLAKILNAEFRQIIFCSSATEANNLALRGALKKFKEKGSGALPHFVTTAIEHESVLETLKGMEREGVIGLTVLPVNSEGAIDPWAIKEAVTSNTILVSVMYANNEIGTVQDIAKIGKLIKALRGKNSYPLFHADAVQAFQFLECDAEYLGVDLMTVSSHKVYGPKGAAILYAKEPELLAPIITGGGQEFGYRSGTENVPAIVGFAKAAEIITAKKEENRKKLRDLALYLMQSLADFSEASLNGPSLKGGRLPNILNIRFPGKNNEEILTKLDIKGIAASAGSACSSRSLRSSHVLKAIGIPEKDIKESIRISLGVPTTKEEVSQLIEALKNL